MFWSLIAMFYLNNYSCNQLQKPVIGYRLKSSKTILTTTVVTDYIIMETGYRWSTSSFHQFVSFLKIELLHETTTKICIHSKVFLLMYIRYIHQKNENQLFQNVLFKSIRTKLLSVHILSNETLCIKLSHHLNKFHSYHVWALKCICSYCNQKGKRKSKTFIYLVIQVSQKRYKLKY